MRVMSQPINALFNAIGGVGRIAQSSVPTQPALAQFVNVLLFATYTQNLPSLRVMHHLLGRRMRVFGGEVAASFNDVASLMSQELEKIDWLSGPMQDRADYLTKSYVPFLLAGPNHSLRRQHIVERVARAHAQLGDLETLLVSERDPDRALVRFLFRHFCVVELDPTEVDWFLEFKREAAPMVLLPKLLRSTLLRGRHERLQKHRSYFLEKIERAGVPFADSWFDVLWFNAGTLGFYPRKALEFLQEDRALRGLVFDEVELPAGKRPKTRALIHEMLRIHGRIPSTNYVQQGKVRIALIATAVVDPKRYHDPLKVDLARDHSDTVAFSGSAPTRKCPAELFAPDAMACVVAVGLGNAEGRN